MQFKFLVIFLWVQAGRIWPAGHSFPNAGLYCLEDAACKSLTVNGERYGHMIETFLKPYLNDFDVEVFTISKMVPHQYKLQKTIALLQEIFSSRLI